MTPRENLLRAYRFECPEYIPATVYIPPESWRLYRGELERIVVLHPLLFPGFEPGRIDFDRLPMDPRNRPGTSFTDPWGCTYEPVADDVPAYVSTHPLADWASLDGYDCPDPERTNGFSDLDWEAIARSFDAARRQNALRQGGLMHGHLFLLLINLRGHDRLLLDMADGDPRLDRLIAQIETFSRAIVDRYVELGVDVMRYPEDLGAQDRPLLSPALFRRYIAPVYRRLMAPARRAGAVVHMHCDGYLWDLMDDLLACGIDVLNLQDLVNGVDRIAAELKGRICIDLDIDRQNITCFGTPREIDDHIREAVMKLGSPRGGLCLRHGLYSGAPIENIDALMTAMERYCFTGQQEI
jgi:hypothetical protein